MDKNDSTIKFDTTAVRGVELVTLAIMWMLRFGVKFRVAFKDLAWPQNPAIFPDFQLFPAIFSGYFSG